MALLSTAWWATGPHARAGSAASSAAITRAARIENPCRDISVPPFGPTRLLSRDPRDRDQLHRRGTRGAKRIRAGARRGAGGEHVVYQHDGALVDAGPLAHGERA